MRNDGGEVIFADQVGIRSDQVIGSTWGEKGRAPVVRRSGNQFSVNAMSVISTKVRMHFMLFTGHFTAEVMCCLLQRLAGHFGRKVHLVVDGHPAHRSREVHNRLFARLDDIELYFPALVLARAESRRVGRRRPQAQPARAAPGPWSD